MRLLARHLIVPALLAAIVLTVGAVSAVPLGGAAFEAADGWLPVSASLAALAVIGMRAVTALKGSIRSRLLAPVPTPAGDMAGVNVLLWTLDGPIDALLIGAGLAILWALAAAGVVAPAAAVLTSLVVLAALLGWARAPGAAPDPRPVRAGRAAAHPPLGSAPSAIRAFRDPHLLRSARGARILRKDRAIRGEDRSGARTAPTQDHTLSA